ncbi:MAG: tail fiber domain-containing protein [Saprospiraceae bacterium]|nr:tail fiber domain-containing protein [Saprospiraceae bacterium]
MALKSEYPFIHKKKKSLVQIILFLMISIGMRAQDTIIDADLQVIGSQCLGSGCGSTVNFDLITLLLKQDNLRIRFDDQSLSSSFPKNDWQITINDSHNGGDSYFSIDDITSSRTIFRLDAGAPANALYMNPSGNIGLGMSNPGYRLHVLGGMKADSIIDANDYAGLPGDILSKSATGLDWIQSTALRLGIYGGSDTVPTSTHVFLKDEISFDDQTLYINGDSNRVGVGTNSPMYELQVNGDVGISGGVYGVSDKSIKKNIEDLTGGLGIVMQLKPRSFWFKTDDYRSLHLPEGKQYGLIAQELESIISDLVTDQNTFLNEQEESEKIKSVNYLGLIPWLIRAMQEQQEMIDDLIMERDSLRREMAKIKYLEDQVKDIMAKLSE